MGFNNWNQLTYTDDQLMRIEDGQRISNKNIRIFYENETATFIGKSGIYVTTLESCTCKDFNVRKKPCKHMYRLAIELKKISVNDIPKLSQQIDAYTINNSSIVDSICDIGVWSKTNDPSQLKRFTDSINCIPESISQVEQSAVFIGSNDVYNTTLKNCTCMDFEQRNIPCKHIYKLAQCLMIVNKDGSKGITEANVHYEPLPADKVIALNQAAKLFENYNSDTLEAIRESILRDHYGMKSICLDISTIDPAVNDGIIITSNDVESIEVVKEGKQKHTIQLLSSVDFQFPTTLKLQKQKYEWCLMNAEEIRRIIYPNACVATTTGCLRIAPSEIYSYLFYAYGIGSGINAITRDVISAQIPIPEIQRLLTRNE